MHGKMARYIAILQGLKYTKKQLYGFYGITTELTGRKGQE